MGFLNKLFSKKKKDENEIPPSTWLPTPPPVTDYDRHTPRHSISPVPPPPEKNKRTSSKEDTFTVTINVSDLKVPAESTTPKKTISHLDENGELPWGWIYENRDFVARIENQNRYFTNAYYNTCNGISVRKKYAALKSLLRFWNNTLSLCKSKGECFEKWFCDIIAPEELMYQYIEELKYMEDNMERLLQVETIKKSLKNDVLNMIKENDGILQTTLYKTFPEELRQDVIEQITNLYHEKRITKEKSGRTYALHFIG